MPKPKPNPHCPVIGCKTHQPHLNDSLTAAIHMAISNPVELLACVREGIIEFINSMHQDLLAERFSAFIARIRQPEEAYVRTLYILFIAAPDEIPHIISGMQPNSFRGMYQAVNKYIYEGNGKLETVWLTPDGTKSSSMNLLNDAAHISFNMFLTSASFRAIPEERGQLYRQLEHMQELCKRLFYMEEMFVNGKPKNHVLVGIKNIHKPAPPSVKP